MIIGCVSLTTQGLKLGIDFKGGTSITLNTEEKLALKDVKQDIKDLGYTLSNVERLNDGSVQVKIEDSLSKTKVLETEEYFEKKYKELDVMLILNAPSNVNERLEFEAEMYAYQHDICHICKPFIS